MSKTIIIGAGPAGLTAAVELLKADSDNKVIILEETGEIGGISRTVNYNGNRIDIGGHRFFSKDDRVMDMWKGMMKVQGAAAYDDKKLGRVKPLSKDGPDPEITDDVILIRDRVSRIYYLRSFFDYPVSLKFETLKNLGPVRTLKMGFSYLKSVFVKRQENTLEDFMINRFGKVLYGLFFRDYNYKLWGRYPSEIAPDWGAQRIKGLDLRKTIINMITSPFKKKDINQKNVETSLIEQFMYPKLGPGQLWETFASRAVEMGAELRLNCKVNQIIMENGKISGVKCITSQPDGSTHEEILSGDNYISSMPIKDLFEGLTGESIPKKVYETAIGLPYRDFITVGVLVGNMKIKNKTKVKTLNNIVPDNWIYIQEPEVTMGRLQIFNNWSPYMVKDVDNKVWIGLEYFCTEGDDKWTMEDSSFINLAVHELETIGIINASDVEDSTIIRVKKAYPAYFDTYKDFDVVKTFLNSIDNLYCVGRNGQHRYNNMDHSMLTAVEAVKIIQNNISDKEALWTINAEREYHESK